APVPECSGVPVSVATEQRSPVSPDQGSATFTYKVGKVIGDGNFAVVKECVERATGQEYALKIIDKARCCGKEHLIENEVAVLRRVRHPSIIQLIEVDETPSQLFLVMELVKGGDLFDAITSSTKYSERDASAMVFNLAGAIKYLHRMNIVHRDIKPENLLVCEYPDGTKSLKLGDFGLATVVEGPLYTVCGTPTYVAPEIIAETGYGLKVDIWAAGVIAYILLCGFPPFRRSNNVQEELFDQILRGKLEFPSPDWDAVSLSAKMLISQMLQVNVDARFTAEEVLSHPWVTVGARQHGGFILGALGLVMMAAAYKSLCFCRTRHRENQLLQYYIQLISWKPSPSSGPELVPIHLLKVFAQGPHLCCRWAPLKRHYYVLFSRKTLLKPTPCCLKDQRERGHTTKVLLDSSD
uniref:non-specific serine/threonine protein kinase n=1 Tax=Fundulus heteroclitus TaxID=8078 RepID=A0A3Q2PPZ0_FUNHE